MANFDDAKRAWANTGARDLERIVRERTSFESILANVRQAQAGRTFFFNPRLYGETVFWTIFLLPFLLLVDRAGALCARPDVAGRAARLPEGVAPSPPLKGNNILHSNRDSQSDI